MNRNQTVAAVARRLRGTSQRDVSEMLTVLIDVWCQELIRPEGYIHIEGLGKLYVEQQTLRSTGAVRAMLQAKQKAVPTLLTRYYFRFRPAEALRAHLMTVRATDRLHYE